MFFLLSIQLRSHCKLTISEMFQAAVWYVYDIIFGILQVREDDISFTNGLVALHIRVHLKGNTGGSIWYLIGVNGEYLRYKGPVMTAKQTPWMHPWLHCCLFAPLAYRCYSLRTCHPWCIGHSMSHQRRGCNNIPSFLQRTAPIMRSFCECFTWHSAT